MMIASSASGGGYYEAFREANPSWTPYMFPSSTADVAEVVAALLSPPAQGTSTLTALAVVARTPEGWARDETEEILAAGSPASAEGDYLVTAVLGCQVRSGPVVVNEARRVWYLLPRNRLASYDHCQCGGAGPMGMGMSCSFKRRPASEAALELEAQAFATRQRSQSDLHQTSCPSVEHYRRGESYLAVGRVREARAMLSEGDAFLELAPDGTVESPGTIAWCRDRAQRQRDVLLRALTAAEGD